MSLEALGVPICGVLGLGWFFSRRFIGGSGLNFTVMEESHKFSGLKSRVRIEELVRGRYENHQLER